MPRDTTISLKQAVNAIAAWGIPIGARFNALVHGCLHSSLIATGFRVSFDCKPQPQISASREIIDERFWQNVQLFTADTPHAADVTTGHGEEWGGNVNLDKGRVIFWCDVKSLQEGFYSIEVDQPSFDSWLANLTSEQRASTAPKAASQQYPSNQSLKIGVNASPVQSGQDSEHIEPYSIEEMHEWMIDYVAKTGSRNGNNARKAFTNLPGGKGLSASFENEWPIATGKRSPHRPKKTAK